MYSENNDTVKILQECDAGVKMSVESLHDAAERADNRELRSMLRDSIDEHEKIGREIGDMLARRNAEGKNPSMIASAMSKIKIGANMLVDNGDETTAKLMYDGCTMGVEKLSEYVNMYTRADTEAKNAAEKLIKCEQRLADELRQYL